MTLKVPFGKKDGRMVEPQDLPSGLDHDCICPGCGSSLIVRKGSKRPHFQHYRIAPSRHCMESALHQMAIAILLEQSSLMLPECAAEAKAQYVPLRRAVLFAEGELRFKECFAEVAVEDVRVDVLGARDLFQSGEPFPELAVEIFVTHAVDSVKLEKLKRLALTTIEIDLSDLVGEPDLEVIRQRVLKDTTCKKWLHSPQLDELQAKLNAEVEAENALFMEKSLRAKQLEAEEYDFDVKLMRCMWASSLTEAREQIALYKLRADRNTEKDNVVWYFENGRFKSDPWRFALDLKKWCNISKQDTFRFLSELKLIRPPRE